MSREPIAGGRLALRCTHEGCGRREFGNPAWRCPDHPTKTVVQANHTYFGKPVPTPEVKGVKTEAAGI